MEYMDYRKSFVLMSEQDKRFVLDRYKKCKGYLKIETGEGKGVIRAGAENLRYFEKGLYMYKLILFGKKKEKTIFKIVGNLAINNRGRGETYLTFDPGNVDGKGNCLDDFSIAIIVAVSSTDHKEALHPVLKGKLEHQSPDKKRKPEKNYNDYYNAYILERCKAIENKSELYDDIIPFKKDKLKAKWKRIVNLGKFPLLSPYSQYTMNRYRHFIFGTTETHYYIGVPGRYLEKEQPESGRSGFTGWQPIVGAEGFCADQAGASLENRQVAYGYWIAAINKENGLIEEIPQSP